jgi:hypothetical protein
MLLNVKAGERKHIGHQRARSFAGTEHAEIRVMLDDLEKESPAPGADKLAKRLSVLRINAVPQKMKTSCSMAVSHHVLAYVMVQGCQPHEKAGIGVG